jgi:hypothetical protein
MKIICIDYPTETYFKTKKDFNNNEERTDWLVSTMKRKKTYSPCHTYDDYVVEKVIPNGELEYWIIGS